MAYGLIRSVRGQIKAAKGDCWNEQSVARAIDYVVNGQGDDLPDFDD
jgi:hypothetical protein